MALELENSVVKINQILQEDNTKNIIESDIIVPDVKPDVVSVLHADGEFKVNSKEIYKDAVVLRGTAVFKILYLSDDPSRLVCSTEHMVNFDQTVDIAGIDSNMVCYLNCNPEHIDCSIINGRKLNVKAVLKVDSKVIEPIEIDLISEISGSDDIQSQMQGFESYNEVEYDNIETGIICEVDIPIGRPAVKDILRTDAVIKEKDIKVTGGKVIAKGTLEVSTLYVPDMEEAPVECTTSEVPFSEVLDMPNSADQADVIFAAEVKSVSAVVKEDEDGDSRVLEYEVGLNFRPSAIESQTLEVVSDAYALAFKLEIEKNPVKVTKLVGEGKSQSTIKDFIQISNEFPSARQIYNLTCKASVVGVDIENDKVNVEGVIESTLIYLSDEGKPVGSLKHHTPFQNNVEIKGVPKRLIPKAIVDIENYSYELAGDRQIELKYDMAIMVKAFEQTCVDVVTRVYELPLDEQKMQAQPSMTVYYIQNGDTLWDIAKKYLTTINELVKVNDIDNPNFLEVGQQLLIPKAS